MRSLNNKGTSLAELIVTVALLAVVLIFMFRLLVDLNNEQTNDTYANNNQIVRAEIIRHIEDDLNNNTLASFKMGTASTTNKLIIEFIFTDGGKSTITAEPTKLTYKDKDAKTQMWSMKDCTINTTGAMVYMYNKAESNIVAFNIDIEVHTNNELNTAFNKTNGTVNNTLDDIIISYIGKNGTGGYTGGNITCLGKGC